MVDIVDVTHVSLNRLGSESVVVKVSFAACFGSLVDGSKCLMEIVENDGTFFETGWCVVMSK